MGPDGPGMGLGMGLIWTFMMQFLICRHVARFCESYMRGVASKAMTSIEQLLNNQITKFTDFEVKTIT